MSISCAYWSGAAASQPSRLPCTVLLLTLVLLAAQLAPYAHNSGFAIAAAGSDAVQNTSSIPDGTILPVRLENGISIKDAQRGQPIEAKIMQDVPLASHEKIPAKSTVKGSIVSVEKDEDASGVVVTLKFNQLETRKEALTFSAYLRAIASSKAVHAAQMPWTGADAGTPNGWADTVQIGGDRRFGDGGAVRNPAKQKVGKGVIGGVLVHVKANPSLGCSGPVNGDDHLQALWVFSSDACGVYDLKGTKIVHTGKAAPLGEIALHFEKDNLKLEAGTGILLRVVSQP